MYVDTPHVWQKETDLVELVESYVQRTTFATSLVARLCFFGEVEHHVWVRSAVIITAY